MRMMTQLLFGIHPAMLAMGILGFNFGKEKVKQDKTSKSTTNTSGSKTGTESLTDTSKTTSRLLSADVESALTDLILGAAGNQGQGPDENLGAVASMLLQRAQSGEEAINSRIGAIVDAERAVSERQVSQFTSEAAAGVGGSTDNTLVMGLNARAREEQAKQLAGLQAGLELQGREMISQELLSSANLFAQESATRASETSQIVQLADVLKGAVASGESNRIAETLSQENFNEMSVQDILETLRGTTKSFSLTGKFGEEG